MIHQELCSGGNRHSGWQLPVICCRAAYSHGWKCRCIIRCLCCKAREFGQESFPGFLILSSNTSEETTRAYFSNHQEISRGPTLGISNDQLQLYEKVEMFDPTIFESLTRDFFNRLKDKIENAQGDRASTMVYLFVDFDDFTKVHLDTYRFQIQDFFLRYFPRLHICARSGLTGTEFLTHNLDTLELGD